MFLVKSHKLRLMRLTWEKHIQISNCDLLFWKSWKQSKCHHSPDFVSSVALPSIPERLHLLHRTPFGPGG